MIAAQRFPLAAERADRRFWEMAEVLEAFMRGHGVRPFDPDDTRAFTLAISEEFWLAARQHAATLSDWPEKPIPGYHQLFGYSIRVDPMLRGDELRLEDRR